MYDDCSLWHVWSFLLCCASPARAWTVCPMNVDRLRKSPMDTPTTSLWVSLVVWLSRQLYLFETLFYFFVPLSQVMNGLIISHNVRDHTNGNAPLTSLPVIMTLFVLAPQPQWSFFFFCKVNLSLWWLPRFQHWSRMVFYRLWQLEETNISLRVSQTCPFPRYKGGVLGRDPLWGAAWGPLRLSAAAAGVCAGRIIDWGGTLFHTLSLANQLADIIFDWFL